MATLEARRKDARPSLDLRRRPRGPLRNAMLAALLVSLCLVACGTEDGPFGIDDNRPFPAPYALGPYAVGRVTFSVVDTDRENRELPVDAWYPVDEEDAVGEPSFYEVLGFARPSQVALDGPPVSDARRFPLVVFSHGSGGLRFQSFFLTELLASHGFVVVAPDHVGNTLLDELGGTFAPLGEMYVARPLDVSFLITRMLQKNDDPGDPFHGRIDPSRIGVCGHSFGGYTSLAMAAGFGVDPPPDLAATLPDGFDTLPPDERVDAVAPIAPVSTAFGAGELAAIDVPVMVLGGTLDTTTPIDPQSTRPFQFIQRRVFRADLQGAVHFSFSNSCDLIQVLLDEGIPLFLIERILGADFTEPCGEDVIPVEDAHNLTNLYVTSLFLRYLKGDTRYDAFLTEDFARREAPEVDYFAKPR